MAFAFGLCWQVPATGGCTKLRGVMSCTPKLGKAPSGLLSRASSSKSVGTQESESATDRELCQLHRKPKGAWRRCLTSPQVRRHWVDLARRVIPAFATAVGRAVVSRRLCTVQFGWQACRSYPSSAYTHWNRLDF